MNIFSSFLGYAANVTTDFAIACPQNWICDRWYVTLAEVLDDSGFRISRNLATSLSLSFALENYNRHSIWAPPNDRLNL